MSRKAMRFPGLMKPVLIVALLGLLSGCGTGGLTDPPASSSGGGGGTGGGGTTPKSVDLLVSNGQLNSDMVGAPTVTLTAIVKDSGNRALVDQPVTFSADSGVLSDIGAKTDANGTATAKLGSSGDPTYRTITVSAAAGSLSAVNYVAVTGTQLNIDPPSFSMPFNDPDGKPLDISLKDSAGKAITGKTVSISSLTQKSTFSAASYVTDGSGKIRVTVKNATDTVGDTITATAIGVSTQSALTINTAKLVVNAPAANAQVPINTKKPFTVTYTKNGNPPVPEKTVYFTTTRGTLTDPLTNLPVSSSPTVGGVATVNISSSNSGPAVLTAYTTDGTVQVSIQASIVFVADTATKMTLSAYPAVINANSPGMTSEQSLIKAIVRDASDNLVMGKAVDFSIIQDASAGALSRASATTDMYGTATTTYIAGSVSGGLNNVKITATVQDTPTVTATTTLTVGGQALFISLATGPTIQKVDPNKYQKDYVALVTDAGGRPVANAVITATVTPQYYMKGYYYVCGPESWCQMRTLTSSKSTAPLVPACANEDGMLQNSLYDFNGILDFDPLTGNSEDQNANNRLDPGNVVSVTAATTDSSGHSTISLIYAQDYAYWVNVRLEVRASLAGSSTSAFQNFSLPGLAKDYTDIKVTPPGHPSPFGSNTTCFPDFSVLAVSDTKISMNWDPSAYAVSYNIYRDPNNVLLQGLLANTTKTTYEDSPVTAGTTYCYEIRQVNASGESPLSPQGSNRVCASSQPKAPTVTATTLSASQIQISWTDAGATQYRIYRDGIRIQDSVTRSIVNANLTPNTQYCYAVSSLNSEGIESSKSSTVCATTQLAAPSTPTGLTATGVLVVGPPDTYKVTLTWNASAGAVLYRVYRDGTLVLSATGVTATDTKDVASQTGYCYAVSAVDVSGNESAQSTQVCTATP